MLIVTAEDSSQHLIIKTRSSAVAVIADRTACGILTLFIVSTTSRPLNKKSVCCQSANPINNYCGSASNPINNYCGSASANSQSAHLSARALQSAVSAHASAVAPNGTVPTRSPRNAITVYWDLGALRFLWCILWLNDTS